jgi:hypothetical protein
MRVYDEMLQQAASSAAPANMNSGNGCAAPSSYPSHCLSLTARCSLQASPVKAGGTPPAFLPRLC